MTNKQADRFLGKLHDCYFGTDPRVNQDLAKQLNGKNVIVAGAGRGIGRACAEFLSFGGLNSLSLVALEQDEVDETAKLCREADKSLRTKTEAFDVQDHHAVRKFLAEVVEEFGSIDVVLMNAGRPPQWLPTSEGDLDIWWDTVGVSLRGAYNFSRLALPVMQKKGGGRIIFTASAGAHSNRGMSSYIVAKLGMVRLAEIIHVENFHEYNIRAFAIHPGSIPTRFYYDFKDKAEGRPKERSYIVEGAEGEDKSAQTAVNFLERGTFDTPYMAAGMVTALASGKLDFMSGRYVDCSIKVEEYEEKHDSIVQNDLYRVRLNVGEGRLIPVLDF
ncbi:uncharacterized protein A1O5_13383 [Cladophialophora psammophila CBS 110553]|uniref:3-oxoacyl-[acyl-carrier protein] reductase n=1 Tax=Cladophialophora psammophila CBS 110553 TaxID=1182543 RepID=W9W493_9EURO|nr:uncharacterized protein A1O5_13383 [Cladophialophora psammophila CBS 110553]EXJ53394.1 hypothetical protein A1O5_13383 [Cladophialophora psammophila CBS 110553]